MFRFKTSPTEGFFFEIACIFAAVISTILLFTSGDIPVHTCVIFWILSVLNFPQSLRFFNKEKRKFEGKFMNAAKVFESGFEHSIERKREAYRKIKQMAQEGYTPAQEFLIAYERAGNSINLLERPANYTGEKTEFFLKKKKLYKTLTIVTAIIFFLGILSLPISMGISGYQGVPTVFNKMNKESANVSVDVVALYSFEGSVEGYHYCAFQTQNGGTGLLRLADEEYAEIFESKSADGFKSDIFCSFYGTTHPISDEISAHIAKTPLSRIDIRNFSAGKVYIDATSKPHHEIGVEILAILVYLLATPMLISIIVFAVKMSKYNTKYNESIYS